MSTAFRMALDARYASLRTQAQNRAVGGSKDTASKAATQFYQSYPEDAEANYCMARALVRQEKSDVALEHAEKANRLKPNHAAYVFLLGRLYLDFQLYEFAAPLLYDAVVKLPNDVLMQWAMADFLQALGKGHDARKHYESALLLNPNREQRTSLLYDYAKCLAETGLNAEADIAFAELENIDGLDVLSLLGRSGLFKYMPDSEMASRLRLAQQSKTVGTEKQAELLLMLGRMHENNAEYDRAFELWSQSRALKPIKGYESFGYSRLEQTVRFYTPELLLSASKFGHSSTQPVFIVGMPRSGTTLTETIISSHADVFGAGETQRIQKLENAFYTDYQRPNAAELLSKNAAAGELVARANETLKLFEVLAGSNVKRVVDKTPTQYLSMGYAHLCFPKAKFIHCQRHPADSFVSAFQNNMNQFHEYSYDQHLYAEAYLTKEKLMAHWRSIFPQNIFDLRYETLVTKPEETVRAVLDFLDLPWDPNCMTFFEKERTVKTFSKDQVRKPIYTSSVYRWKNYEKHLGPLFEALRQAGYTYPEF